MRYAITISNYIVFLNDGMVAQELAMGDTFLLPCLRDIHYARRRCLGTWLVRALTCVCAKCYSYVESEHRITKVLAARVPMHMLT